MANKRGRPAANAKKSETISNSRLDNVFAIISFATMALLIFSIYINLMGAFGSFLKLLLTALFGVTAYILPVLAFLFGVFLLHQNKKRTARSHLLTSILLVVALSALCYLALPAGYFHSFGFISFFIDGLPDFCKTGIGLGSGGLIGGLVAYPLIMLLSKVGFGIIFAAALFILLIMLFDLTLYQIFAPLWRSFKGAGSFMAEREIQAAKQENLERERPVRQKKERVYKPTLVDGPVPVGNADNIDVPLDEEFGFKPPDIILEEEQQHFPNEPDEVIKPIAKIPVFVHDDIDPTEYITTSDTNTKQSKSDKKSHNTAGKSGYSFPPYSLLESPKATGGVSRAEIQKTEQKLISTLHSFGVETVMVGTSIGPNVTRYELAPQTGVRVSKITSLADDIALSLAATQIRIEAPIPGKAAIGIEIPNKNSSMVYIKELLSAPEFERTKSPLSIALGKDISGNPVFVDLSKMPHLLIAGATGSGKSVCLNSILVSLLYKASPDEVKLILIDPKVVELGIYASIPHLFIPVVNNSKKAAGALQWAASEMDRRYNLFKEVMVRDIDGYNTFARNNPLEYEALPKIIVVIDELADLMMVAAKEVEDHICRLCQKARAAGIFLVIATQRPSVNVVTGLIKANVPSRIAFAVASQVDSRVILDTAGADKLLGRGDMLFKPISANKAQRIQGCYVSDHEVEAVVEYVRNNNGAAQYDQTAEKAIDELAQEAAAKTEQPQGDNEAVDEMLMAAIECVIETGQASTSYLQRKLKLGYARAARIVDTMEELGVVGPFEGSKPREVRMSKNEFLELRNSFNTR